MSGLSRIEWAVEGALLVLIAILGGRVLLRRPTRRELGAHPWLSVTIAAGAALATMSLVWIAGYSDVTRRVVAGAAGLVTLAAVLRARPAYGRSRGLPPGSLGIAVSLDAIDDRQFYARVSDRWGPTFKMSQIHRPVACITDLPTWLELIESNPDALEQSDWAFNRLVPEGYLEYMDGDVHTRYRNAFAPAFTKEAVAASRGAMIEVTRAQLRAMAADGGQTGVDPEPYLLPIAQTSLMRIVLGVERSHEHFSDLSDYFTDLSRPLELFFPAPRSTLETYRWLAEAVPELVVGTGPAIGSPSVIVDLVATDPSAVADPNVVGNLVLMVKEGSIMVRGMLRWILKMLADHPREVERLRAAASDPDLLDALATAFVRETLRLHESPYLYRSVVRDVRLGPYRIPRGWLVRVCLAEAHARRDSFGPDPERFDPSRFLRTEMTPEVFCPFGSGRHACLGADVAVEIGKIVVRETALRYDLRTLQDGPAWRVNRHWGLWRPSQRWRLSLVDAR